MFSSRKQARGHWCASGETREALRKEGTPRKTIWLSLMLSVACAAQDVARMDQVGEYEMRPGFNMTIKQKGSGLTTQMPGQPAFAPYTRLEAYATRLRADG